MKIQEFDSVKLRFVKSAELEVVESCDEDGDDVETSNEVFNVGDEIEVDILTVINGGESISFQFADGSCTYAVPSDLFEVVKS